MDKYALAALHIIKEQQMIIGPLAIDQAKKVSGIQLVGSDEVKLSGEGKELLSKLVSQYALLFGQASVEVCKDAVKELHPPIPSEQLPEILQ